MYLYHYYDKKTGPFRNLTDLSRTKAEEMLLTLKQQKPNTQCAKRQDSYIQDRIHYEDILRVKFKEKDGKMERYNPHYMVLEHSPWLTTWYQDLAYIKIPIEEFDLRTLSFTYGDSHPTFSPSVKDKKEYRNMLYTYSEILQTIQKYDFPQNWNDDGKFGPERYIEVHVWSDKTISNYCDLPKVEQAENYKQLFSRLVPTIPELKTDRLVLNEITPSDIPAYNALILDKKRNEFWGYDDIGAQGTNIDEDRFYKVVKTDFNHKEAINFAVRLLNQNLMIGEAVLYDFDRFGGAELGCRIDSSMSGRGYGTEAFQKVLNWSFEYLNLRYVNAKCFHANKASYQMLSSCMDYVCQDDIYHYFIKHRYT